MKIIIITKKKPAHSENHPLIGETNLMYQVAALPT
jgi:hypothetical protein